MSVIRKMLALVVVVVSISVVVPAQEPTPPPTANQQPAASPSARGPEYVQEKGFKGKVFDVKYRDAYGLSRAIGPLGSGFKGAAISVNPEMKTLTVRDFPENIAQIEEALKRLDTPEAPRPDIEFTVHVLIASNAAAVASADYPPLLNDVVKQLQTTLRYKSYGLMTSAMHRAKEGPHGVNNSGVAESKLFDVPRPEGSPTFFEYNLENVAVDVSSGSPVVHITQFRFNMRIPLVMGISPGGQAQIQYQNVGFRSPVSLKQGEKVVVGSTTMGDKGLIVVISARVLK